MDGFRPLYTPAALALAIPSSWRSRRRFVSNSANTPSISRKHLPAAVLVSIGCSVAFNEAPLARTRDHNPAAVGTRRLPGPRREVGRHHVVWHYRIAMTAVASIAGMMLRCGK